MSLSHLQIRNPKEDETGPEAATQIFSSLLSGQHSLFKRLYTEICTLCTLGKYEDLHNNLKYTNHHL